MLSLFMPVSVVQIRHVRMIMSERCVPMRMAVRFGGRVVWLMFVQMVRVIAVDVFVLDFFMGVLVRVAFSQKEPNSKRHGHHRAEIRHTDSFSTQHNVEEQRAGQRSHAKQSEKHEQRSCNATESDNGQQRKHIGSA